MPGIDVMISKIFSPKIGDFYSNYNYLGRKRITISVSKKEMVCLPQKPTYVPWRHGEMVIVSSSRTEDPRFDFPPGYKVF
jgi:hypothetical protein